MYDEHFGLSGRPFQLTPDPRFWYETATHRKAMAYLGYGLAQGEGFIVVTGDIGAGKTTLVGHLLDGIDRDRLNPITIMSTAIEAEDVLRIVAHGLHADPAGLAKSQLLLAIQRGLHAVARTGRRTLLIVDEAQALPVSALEELRMLSNFQAGGGHALLQILLLGQPEFRERLQGEDRLEQLRQRVIAVHHLDPMSEGEVSDYLTHRLSVVGWDGRPGFTADAFAALHRGSGGVPRRLNQLAGRVMLYAATEGSEVIDARAVDTVLADMQADMARPAPVRAEAGEPALGGRPKLTIAPGPAPSNEAAGAVSPPAEEASVDPVAVDPVAAAEPRPEPPPDPRLAALEMRVEMQEAALRRVLALLVEWIESDIKPPNPETLRDWAA